MKMNPELIDRTIIALTAAWAELMLSQSPSDKLERTKIEKLINYWLEIKENDYEIFWKSNNE